MYFFPWGFSSFNGVGSIQEVYEETPATVLMLGAVLGAGALYQWGAKKDLCEKVHRCFTQIVSTLTASSTWKFIGQELREHSGAIAICALAGWLTNRSLIGALGIGFYGMHVFCEEDRQKMALEKWEGELSLSREERAIRQEAVRRIFECKKNRSETLDLLGLKLTSFPPTLEKLTSVKQIYYSYLDAPIPESLKEKTRQIKTVEEANQNVSFLEEYRSLREALNQWSQGNALKEAAVDKIKKAYLLSSEALDLTNQGIDQIPSCINKLRFLKKLILNNNPGLSLEGLNLPDLEVLKAAHCQIESVNNLKLPKLTFLDLSCNNISAMSDLVLPSLKVMRVNSNPIGEFFSTLAWLPNTCRVVYSGSPDLDPFLHEFASLPEEERDFHGPTLVSIDSNIPFIIPHQLGVQTIEPLFSVNVQEIEDNPVEILSALLPRMKKGLPMIRYAGAIAIDQAGVSRDFVSRIFQSICQKGGEQHLMIKEQNQKLKPLIEDENQAQITVYQAIGALFGFALQRHKNILTGSYFHSTMFKMLHTFSSSDLVDVTNYNQIPDAIKDRLYAVYAENELHFTKEQIESLLQGTVPPELTTIGDSKEDFLSEDYKKLALACYVIAKSLLDHLRTREDWNLIKGSSDEVLAKKIEGALTREQVLASLKWEENQELSRNTSTKTFLKKWIEECSEKDLETFVWAISGSKGLNPDVQLKIKLYSEADKFPEYHTCFFEMVLPNGYPNYEVFKSKLETGFSHIHGDSGFQLQ